MLAFYKNGVCTEGFKNFDFSKRSLPSTSLCQNVSLNFSSLVRSSKQDIHHRIQVVSCDIGDNSFSPSPSSIDYVVDGVILVRSLYSPACRAEKQKFWASYRTWTSVSGIMCLIAGGSVGIAATSSLAGVALGVVLITLAFFSFSRASEAHTQVKRWSKHPAHDSAQLRTFAYGKGGFSFVFTEHLKERGLLHPSEVNFLFRESIKHERKNFETAGRDSISMQLVTLRKFFAKGLFQAKVLQSLYPIQHPFHQGMDEIQKRYSTLEMIWLKKEDCFSVEELRGFFAEVASLVIEADILLRSRP